MNERVTYGLACGVIGIAVRLLTFTFKWDMAVATQFYLLVILVGVFLGIRSVRQQGIIGYRKFFKGGLQVGAISTLVISAYTYVHYAFIDVEYFSNRIIERVNAAKLAGLDADQIAIQEANARFIFSPGTQSTFTLAAFLIATVFYALLTAFLYKKLPLFSKI